MTSVVRTTLLATLTTAVIAGIELSIFAVVGPLPAPIPSFVNSITAVLSVIVVCAFLLLITETESDPPATDMRDEYELPNEYHWPVDER